MVSANRATIVLGMYAGKPIIGISGGIGSGKTFVAGLFAELGGLVISADKQVHQAYQRQDVKDRLKAWWGGGVIDLAGNIDRGAVGRIVFGDVEEKRRLESYIHPIVTAEREQLMARHANDAAIRAYVWDIPLLFEANLQKGCDCLIFVDAPLALRQKRVLQSRGWSAEELAKRENFQLPLDKKRSVSHYVVTNAGDLSVVREQVRDVFSRLLSGLQRITP